MRGGRVGLFVGTGVAAVLAGLAGLAVFGSGSRALRLLVVGIDGAEWRIIKPMVARGELPNLSRLIESGTSGPLRSIEPLISPPIWTSIATGVKPERHGITWFLCDTDRPGARIPVTSTLRKTKAIWNVLSERGRVVGVIGWWATFPAERVRGFVVSDFAGYHGFGNTGRIVESDIGKAYPPSLVEDVAGLIADPRTVSFERARRFLDIEEREWDSARRGEGPFGTAIALFASYLATAEGYARIAEVTVRRFRPEALLIYFELVDATSHLFARFAPPRMGEVSEEGWSRFSRTVEEVYRFQDELLGRLLALAGEETAVVVVSDHGFRWGDRRPAEGDAIQVGSAHLWHEDEGILVAKGPGIRPDFRVSRASVLDVTPTLLRYLGVPVARDLDGAPLIDLFSADWLENHPPASVGTFGSPRGSVSSGQGEWEEAARTFSDEQQRRLEGLGYLSRGGASPEMRAGRIRLLLEDGRLDEAETEARSLVRQKPEDPAVRVLMAEIHRATGRLILARREYEAAVDLAPREVSIRCGLAEVLAEEGDLRGSEAHLRAILEGDAASVRALVDLGHVLNLQGRIEEARLAFESAIETRPETPLALFNLAVLDEREGGVEEAERRYREVLRLVPGESRARTNLAVLLLKRGARREAMELLIEAADLAPHDPEIRYNLGTCYLEEGMPEKAVEEFEAALEAKPDLVLAHLLLGRAHLALGEAEKARRSLEVAARLDASDPEARYVLAAVDATLGDFDRARVHLREAVARGGPEFEERARAGSLFAPLFEEAEATGKGQKVDRERRH